MLSYYVYILNRLLFLRVDHANQNLVLVFSSVMSKAQTICAKSVTAYGRVGEGWGGEGLRGRGKFGSPLEQMSSGLSLLFPYSAPRGFFRVLWSMFPSN